MRVTHILKVRLSLRGRDKEVLVMVCVRVELTLFGPSVGTSLIVRSFSWPSSAVEDRELTTKDLSSGAMK